MTEESPSCLRAAKPPAIKTKVDQKSTNLMKPNSQAQLSPKKGGFDKTTSSGQAPGEDGAVEKIFPIRSELALSS